MRALALLTLGVSLTSACVYTGATMMNTAESHPAICLEGVQLFTGAERVPGEYREVAVLNSRGDAEMTSAEGMIKSQRKKAAQLGANGLILGEQKDPSTGTKLAHDLLGTSAERKGKATAIYIPGDSIRVRETCATVSGAATQRT